MSQLKEKVIKIGLEQVYVVAYVATIEQYNQDGSYTTDVKLHSVMAYVLCKVQEILNISEGELIEIVHADNDAVLGLLFDTIIRHVHLAQEFAVMVLENEAMKERNGSTLQ